MTSTSKDKAVSGAFRLLRLDSVKRRIMLFAIVATLLPALTTTGLFYAHNKRALKEKTTAELLNASALIARESRLWLKERFYDVRVFSSSYEVSENLEHVVRGSSNSKAARRRLKTYLESVRGRFTYYEELTVFDLNTKVVARSGGGSPLEISKSWVAQIKKDKGEVDDAQIDGKLGKIVLPIVVAIRSSTGKLLGGFAAKLNLNALHSAVSEISLADGQQVYLLKENGAVIVSAHAKTENLLEVWLGSDTIDSLMRSDSASVEYKNERGQDVLGTLERVSQPNWLVLAEIPVAQAFSQIRALRNQTALVVSLLLIGIGSIAYVLGASIARPLGRLIDGAGRVADGDLAVTISTESKGELGYLTRVFNEMVGRLRVGREELERISITDSLTGIYNRKYLNEKLAEHVSHAQEARSKFSILMIDVDHFKAYNDNYGHVAGDRVLGRLGPLLKAQLRSSGFVARYGGEEFFALLPDVGVDDAVKVADRIRSSVADEPFDESGDVVRLTLSIGVATFEDRGETPESIVAAADKALYRAKKNGRNRVTKARRKSAA